MEEFGIVGIQIESLQQIAVVGWNKALKELQVMGTEKKQSHSVMGFYCCSLKPKLHAAGQISSRD